MAFLRINGVTVPVLTSGASREDEQVGEEDERTQAGGLVSEFLTDKGGWPFAVKHTDRSTAMKYRKLIRGEGDFWPFTSSYGLYSSRGRPVVSAGGLVLEGAGSNGYGAAKIAAGGSDGTLPMSVTSGTWTIGGFVNTLGFMFTQHHVMRSDGEYFINGVAQGSWITTWFEWGGDGVSFKLKAHGSDNHFWHQVFAVPFAIPNAWASEIYLNTTYGGWGPLPHVVASGDFVDDGIGATRVVRGYVESEEVVRGSLSGTHQSVPVLRARLVEV